VTAMIPIFIYPMLGIATANDISNVYFSDSNVLFFGSMVLAVAVEASNFHERVALRILIVTGPNPRRLLLGFMLATTVLSLFISNTATTALMVPIIVAVIRELENCRQR
jgi:sodium-dependent dicarboxylate transporter 2/3/5